MKNTVKNESTAQYQAYAGGVEENQIIEQALAIIDQRMKGRAKYEVQFTKPQLVKDHAKLDLGMLEHEVFRMYILNNQHNLITAVDLFAGTIDGASVYPREVLKEVLKHNGAAVILAHNHPSGISTPSQADRAITKRLVDALGLIDVRVLDHIVVGNDVESFAELGWI